MNRLSTRERLQVYEKCGLKIEFAPRDLMDFLDAAERIEAENRRLRRWGLAFIIAGVALFVGWVA